MKDMYCSKCGNVYSKNVIPADISKVEPTQV